MTEIPIDGARGTVELRHGVLHVRWIPDLAICEEAAVAVMSAVNELSRGRSFPMLVDMAATASMSRGARRVFARPSTVAKVALLGSSPVDRAIANFFLGLHAPAAPTRYFTCAKEAIRWLKDA
ncbi:STAS/SEC14 domain-containing protein [Arthrobacter sp. B10-11]|jgi:hypothetical protein|uniref:DUF7793 family protein n=1 Tax=Arthrobacter sp. B10-11 TaxID=3081160 RepID=UPI002953017E|nr:STAS/SEC14 domain-containing protein [Arthrobacter sp. B10-11]MDV8147233.1 STAS/SEC14 domain-containing protein [Arthrobacter sp. B10-11]